MPIGQYLEGLQFHDYTQGGPHGKGGFEGTDPSAPWISDDVRQNLMRLGPFIERMIEEQFGGRFLAESEAANRGRTQQKRMSADEAAAAGLAPGYFAGISAEGDNQFLSQLASLRGQAVAGEAGAKADLYSGITNALNQNEQYINSLVHQAYLASSARSAARESSKRAMTAQIVTGAFQGLSQMGAAALGGMPGGGSQSLTQQMGGGTPGMMAPDQAIGFSQPQSAPLSWGSTYQPLNWGPT